MGKIWIEVCLISARGLRRIITSSFFKLQWFAVGWIDPNNKYCTRIDTSGDGNPVWKTKFSVAVDVSEMNFSELALFVEVHSREPVFLRSSLLGTATIVLKEFLDKYNAKSHEMSKPVEEVGSFQIWTRNSNKPRGFVDVSIRVSEEREEPSSSYAAVNERRNLFNTGNGVEPFSRYGSVDSQRPHPTQSTLQYPVSNYPMLVPQNYSQSGIKLVSRNGPSVDSQQPNQNITTPQQPEPKNPVRVPKNYLHGGIKLVSRNGSSVDSQRQHDQSSTTFEQHKPNNSRQIPQNYSHSGIKLVSRYGSSVDSHRPNQSSTTPHQPKRNNSIQIPSNYSQHYSSDVPTYQLPQTSSPQPLNVGYTPNNFPRIDHVGQSHISTLPSGRRVGDTAGFGMGLGAGAFAAAGAMIFGDDFMSGYDEPDSLRDPSPAISNNPSFYMCE